MQEQPGISRREALKRGAALGGSLIWAVPTIQAIGMSPAFAQEASPRCEVYYAAKIEVDDEVVVCTDIFNQSAGPGKCLDVTGIASGGGFAVSSGGCSKITATSTNDGEDWTVTLGEGCQLWDAAVGIKSGGGPTCVGSPLWEYNHSTRTITFRKPAQDISHVEFIFCCAD